MPSPEIPRHHQTSQDEAAKEHLPLVNKLTKALRGLLGRKSKSRLDRDLDEILKEDERAERALKQGSKHWD